MIKRRKIKADSEFLLLGGMIMSTDVMSAVYRRYKAGELRTGHFTSEYKTIFRWLVGYYAKFHKAPQRTIKTIYEDRSRSLREDTKELVEEYLDRLATEYAEQDEQYTDPEYLQQEILPNFIREREIQHRIDAAQNKIDAGNYEAAEQEIAEYHKVSEVEEDETLGTILPLTPKDVKEGIKPENQAEAVFRFSGDLHRLIGPLCKSWLVAVSGVEKAGKSHLVQDIAYDAAVFQKRRVLVINLELNQALARMRLWRKISTTTNAENVGWVIYPILDCENNQYRTCKVLKRFPNKEPLYRSVNETVVWKYSKHRDWKICQKCRSNTRVNAARTKRFVPAVFYDRRRIRLTNEKRILRAIKRNRFHALKNLRIKCFPRYSVSFDEVYDFIKRYIDKQQWHPDIVIWDYLDILAPDKEREERIIVDRIWKKASMMSGELNCLCITPDQANKASRNNYRLDQMSTSESKTKDSHLDVRLSINKTDLDADAGVARVGVIFHRHLNFSVKREVIITQRLETSDAILDNAFLYDEKHNGYKISTGKL